MMGTWEPVASSMLVMPFGMDISLDKICLELTICILRSYGSKTILDNTVVSGMCVLPFAYFLLFCCNLRETKELGIQRGFALS